MKHFLDLVLRRLVEYPDDVDVCEVPGDKIITFKVSLNPGKKAIVITSQGNPDPKAFESAAHGLAGVLKLYGFNVNDTIQLTAGNSPATARENKGLMDRAKEDGRSL